MEKTAVWVFNLCFLFRRILAKEKLNISDLQPHTRYGEKRDTDSHTLCL